MKRVFILGFLLILQVAQMSVSANGVRLKDKIETRGNASSRCPSKSLNLEQSNHILTLPDSEELMLIRLSVEETVVYEELVSSMQETIEFPNYLQGEYQISLVMGDKEYVGTIKF